MVERRQYTTEFGTRLLAGDGVIISQTLQCRMRLRSLEFCDREFSQFEFYEWIFFDNLFRFFF